MSVEARRWNHRDDNDDFVQPRALFNLFSREERDRLFLNLAEAMYGIPQFIIDRQLKLFDGVDPAYGAGVRKALEAVAACKGADATMKTEKMDRMALDETDAAPLPNEAAE